MSASTVSITANPTSRRRSVLTAAEKRNNSNIDLLAADHLPQSKTNADSTAAANGRDHSHHSAEIRSSGDALQQIKKSAAAAAAASTISPLPTTTRRTRKATPPPPPKPLWQTVASVFAKNFVLLVLILGLIQMVRKLAFRSVGDGGGSFAASEELEGRIAEVERLVKTTARMIQVQVEVVDRKIDGEVGVLREEVAKRIEERNGLVEKRLDDLVEKSVGLERSLGELKGLDWLSKEEFERMYEDLKKKMRVSGGNGGEAALDDVRAYARDVVMREIERHAADGLGQPDYALASGGAAVVKHSEAFVMGKSVNWFPGPRTGVRSDSEKMLRPSFGEPGQCFPLKGCSGFVQIKLRTAIVPEAVTLEHVAKSVAYDRSSAPKNCRISGWLQKRQNHEETNDVEQMFLLTEFTYDLEKSNAQTFNVLKSAGSGIVDTVRFDFTSNHGNPSHTCIYRLRVHGHEPDSVSMMPIQS